MPFVLIGSFGAADALLPATIGAWASPVFVHWTAGWTSVAGGVLAMIAWGRGQATFPYVPAIVIGVALTIVTGGLHRHPELDARCRSVRLEILHVRSMYGQGRIL